MIACEIRSTGTSAILEKIMELQQEIALINLHERTHVGNVETNHLEPTCSYCQGGARAEQSDEGRKRPTSLSELERYVESSGRNGNVLVPKSWSGKRVKVVLLE